MGQRQRRRGRKWARLRYATPRRRPPAAGLKNRACGADYLLRSVTRPEYLENTVTPPEYLKKKRNTRKISETTT